MRAATIAFACLGAFWLGLVAQAQAAAQTAARPPFELTRSLQALQDQIALGNVAAHEAQRKLLFHTGEQFLAAEAEAWSDLRNARAAVVFVLSGGSPKVFAELLRLGRLSGLDKSLVEGALAYAEGRKEDARKSLATVDSRRLPPSLGGNVALVQATLAMEHEPKAALPLLDRARLLMPGTLVEEAALRRQVFVAADLGELNLFRSLALQYLRRFGGSVYAAALRQQLAVFLTARAGTGDPTKLAELEQVVAQLGEAEQRAVQLALARSALVAGDVVTAQAAAGKTLALAGDNSPDSLRAHLYQSAAKIIGGDVGEGVAALESLDAGALEADDARLREAALSIARQVGRRPEGAALPQPAGALPVAVPAETRSAAAVKAEKALAAVDALLRGRPE